MSGQILLLLVVTALLFFTGVTLLRLANRLRVQSSLLAFQLSFPRGLKVEEVESFLDGLTGMLLPWWQRWLTSPYVVIETEADESGIRHFLLVPAAWEQSVLGLLSANLPGVRFTPCDTPNPAVVVGSEYRLTNNKRDGRRSGGHFGAVASQPASARQT